MPRAPTNVIGFDDAPFPPEHRGDVDLVGTVCSRTRLDGVLRGRVRRDGINAARTMARMLLGSPFAGHVQAVLLQGITVAGFNVVDLDALHAAVGVPVIVVARRRPDLARIRRALLAKVPGGATKWRRIQAAGPPEPIAGVFVQRTGLSALHCERLLRATTLHGRLPEPLRLAHLIAGGLGTGVSRGRA